MTLGQPAAMAGPILRASMEDGKFHGVIAATTPTLSLRTMIRRPGKGEGTRSP